jgi:hypothetical protein
MKKIALIGMFAVLCCVAMGATLKGGMPFGDLEQAKKIATAVGAFYKGCENEKASVIMAELAMVALAKENDKDAVPYLQASLEEIKEPGLRNFTMFLMAHCHHEKGDIDKSFGQLLQIVKESN